MQAGWTPITSAISSASPPPPPSGILMGVARQEQHADTIGSAHLTAMNRDVLNAVLRIARDEQRRSNIGSAIEFVVFGNRQLAKQIDMTMHHLLSWRFGNLDPWYRPAHRILKMRKQILDCHPERSATHVLSAKVRNHRNLVLPVPETTRRARFPAAWIRPAISSFSERPYARRQVAPRREAAKPGTQVGVVSFLAATGTAVIAFMAHFHYRATAVPLMREHARRTDDLARMAGSVIPAVRPTLYQANTMSKRSRTRPTV